MTREETIIDIRDNIKPIVVDCISRQAVLDLFNKSSEYSWEMSLLRKKIEKMPSVIPQPMVVPIAEVKIDKDKLKELVSRAVLSVTPQEPRWIPVSEKLPEIHNYCDNYLVTLKRGGIYIAMFTECDGQHWWTYDDVVAWMPLPKTYEPQESEDKE